MEKLETRAPAKLNLTLAIGPRRDDGYHPIKSVMVHVSLFDTVSVRKKECGIGFSSNARYLRNDDKNLCVLAARRYLELAGIKEGVDIELLKHIPSKSGMGGGSADAAAVVSLMEKLFVPLDSSVRDSLLLSLGADVPFCATSTPALCEGIGERITPILLSGSLEHYLVIAKNAQKPSTAGIYSVFDSSPVPFEGSHSDVIRALETGNAELLKKGMYNAFEPIIFSMYPEVEHLRDRMLSLGAYAAQMTGAGPSVFGLFPSKAHADKALGELRESGVLSYVARII